MAKENGNWKDVLAGREREESEEIWEIGVGFVDGGQGMGVGWGESVIEEVKVKGVGGED